MRVLMVGDVVGRPGRQIFAKVVKRLRNENAVHAVVVNGENAAAGNGITVALAQELFKAGADVITLGDHTWGQRELESTIGGEKNLIRPVNYAAGVPGKGWTLFQSPIGPFIVVNLQGRVFMNPIDCPFAAMEELLKTLPKHVPILVDFHAEATSEKIAMGYFLDGRVTAVVGTHTHVQTNDAKILPKGTAYLSDLGMTGPSLSVLGRDVSAVLRKFTTGMPTRFEVAGEPAYVEGAIIEFDRTTGVASSIQTCRYWE